MEDKSYIQFNNINDISFIKHCFTTRKGGVSENEFSSFNFAFGRGDKDESVKENYKIIGEKIGFTVENYVTAKQTHTTNVRVVTKADIGKGVWVSSDFSNIDGLITNEKNIPLVIFGADCVPVFLVDTVKKAIGVAHCGWVGTANRMSEKILMEMIKNFNCNPKDIVVGIGASIGDCCFQVDRPVLDIFEKNIDFFMEFTKKDIRQEDKYLMDLWGINKKLLEDLGVKNIEISGLCTMCNSDLFYSYRVMGDKRGNMAGILEIS